VFIAVLYLVITTVVVHVEFAYVYYPYTWLVTKISRGIQTSYKLLNSVNKG